MARGKFITFEGGEGAGKSTVIRYIHKKLTELGYASTLTREPGGCPFSEKVRDLVMSDPLQTKTELFLMLAARTQHIHEVIEPALAEGQIVLCDRFTHSTLAYQGYARGLGAENIASICAFAEGEVHPDLALFFDIEPKLGLLRAKERGDENRMDKEKLAFHESVYEGFQSLVKREELTPIDATLPLEAVQDRAWQAVKEALA